MAENKTRFTDVPVADFLAAVPDPKRRADAEALVRMMREVTGEEPRMYGPTIVGFGYYRHTYASGHSYESGVAGFSPRKSDLVVYVEPGFQPYADLMAKLGKYRTGKVCLYIKKLADVDVAVLRELIARSTADVKAKHGR
jgi:hypothetical protein